MHTASPAATAAPLHLYDYTHGQRRLTIWRESDANGIVYVIATLAVPVVEQAPGEAPQIQWVRVASAVADRPQLFPAGSRETDATLALDGARFDVHPDEADAIADYLGPALGGEGAA